MNGVTGRSITLYQLEATSAVCDALPAGAYRVLFDVRAKKLRADERGEETDAGIDDYADIRVAVGRR